MLRLLFTVLLTGAFVAFAWANTHRVQFSFVVGETDVRLIFLVVASFAGGVLTMLLNAALEDAKHRALARQMRTKMTALQQDDFE
jgi:uncharacterized integral membrane protein